MDTGREIYINMSREQFAAECLRLHKRLDSAVMTYFAEDLRKEHGVFRLYCVFLDKADRAWAVVSSDLPAGEARTASLSREMFSAALFEREMGEMFGIEFEDSLDTRRLSLHDEVWPKGHYPLRKDFSPGNAAKAAAGGDYRFNRVDGEGIFEVPVGPVHAGIIGPGHFRFSSAGEPVINLETRLGFTHRGVEKLFEGMEAPGAVSFSEKVSGDSAFAYSCAFCRGIESIYGAEVPMRARLIRAVFLELERMYNHAGDIGGIAVDVGFGYPNALASVVKEDLLALNRLLTGSRYLKGVNRIGGVNTDITDEQRTALISSVRRARDDVRELGEILHSSVSFMDRVDSTGILKKKTAADLGVTGLAARASGIQCDLRGIFDTQVYGACGFKPLTQGEGDVLARLNMRLDEFEASAGMINKLAGMLDTASGLKAESHPKAGAAIGCVEAWRGPLLIWVRTDPSGRIERCKITDPSFKNWQGLCFAVLGNIIPDFPLCNKSFDLSYPGNDL